LDSEGKRLRHPRFQFERLGYFCIDPDSFGGNLIFNRTASLRDEWAKIQKIQENSQEKL